MASRWFARRPRWIAALSLFTLCAVLRLGLVDRHGLWADELFSLAMATGHSLEHPAAEADPALGDYVEFAQPAPVSAYSRYLEHDSPAASPARVVRAVLKSDTSPPLYYLLLYGWTRAVGTSDAALRLFSVAWTLACFPVLWSLARRLGGRAAALPTGVLFTFSVPWLYYSTEGRMYSLLWFCTVSSMWLALRLRQRGVRPGWYLLWVLAGVAGLLTHYFFSFVWAAGLLWLWLYPGRFTRAALVFGAFLTGLLVLPWYARLPESLAAWRVTQDWLNYPPRRYIPVLQQLGIPWSYFSLRTDIDFPVWVEAANFAVFVALAGCIWRPLLRSLFRPRLRLPWFWLLGAYLGLLAFDLLQGTYAMTHARYALPGMPAAFLLVGYGLSRLRPRPQAVFTVLIVAMDLIGITRLYMNEARAEDFRQVGKSLAEHAGASDLVIVHSTPSGVAGVAYYTERQGPVEGVGFASWVGQLGQRRVPEDLAGLAADRRKIYLVKIHEVGEPAPQETWLRRNAVLAEEEQFSGATVLCFVPRAGGTFFAAPPGDPKRGRER